MQNFLKIQNFGQSDPKDCVFYSSPALNLYLKVSTKLSDFFQLLGEGRHILSDTPWHVINSSPTPCRKQIYAPGFNLTFSLRNAAGFRLEDTLLAKMLSCLFPISHITISSLSVTKAQYQNCNFSADVLYSFQWNFLCMGHILMVTTTTSGNQFGNTVRLHYTLAIHKLAFVPPNPNELVNAILLLWVDEFQSWALLAT